MLLAVRRAKAICPKSIEQAYPQMESCGKTVDVSQGFLQSSSKAGQGTEIIVLC
jgi:hypothetical protein